MSKLIFDSITKSDRGEESDFADALHSVASQIQDAIEYDEEFSGSASSGDVTIRWHIEEGKL